MTLQPDICSNPNNRSSLNLIPSLKGRLSRIDYLTSFMFWSCMAFICVLIGLALICSKLGLITHLENPDTSIIYIICCALAALFFYVMCQVAAITVRRLHDIDLNGWWLLPVFVPFILEAWLFITFTVPATLACTITSLAGVSCTRVLDINVPSEAWIYAPIIYALVGFWWLIIFTIPGTPAPNRFGEVTSKPRKRLSFIILGIGAMLIISALPFLIISFLLMLLDAMRGWHC